MKVTPSLKDAILAYSQNPLVEGQRQVDIIKRFKLRDHRQFKDVFHKVLRAETIKKLDNEV